MAAIRDNNVGEEYRDRGLAVATESKSSQSPKVGQIQRIQAVCYRSMNELTNGALEK